MIARLSITELPDGEILIDGQPTDFCPPWKTEDAIRQQARDIAELRTDLAAAVAENAALLAANRDCIWHFDAIKADYDAMKLRAEQAEARLAAIDSAPTVATIVAHTDEGGIWPALDYEDEDLPPIGTHLIARPAKD